MSLNTALLDMLSSRELDGRLQQLYSANHVSVKDTLATGLLSDLATLQRGIQQLVGAALCGTTSTAHHSEPVTSSSLSPTVQQESSEDVTPQSNHITTQKNAAFPQSNDITPQSNGTTPPQDISKLQNVPLPSEDDGDDPLNPPARLPVAHPQCYTPPGISGPVSSFNEPDINRGVHGENVIPPTQAVTPTDSGRKSSLPDRQGREGGSVLPVMQDEGDPSAEEPSFPGMASSNHRYIFNCHSKVSAYLCDKHKVHELARSGNCSLEIGQDAIIISSPNESSLAEFVDLLFDTHTSMESTEQDSCRLPGHMEEPQRDQLLAELKNLPEFKSLIVYIASRNVFILGGKQAERQHALRIVEAKILRCTQEQWREKRSHTYRNGVIVTVIKGDITDQIATAIVNTSDEYLLHKDGLSKDIALKGGTVIKDECRAKLQDMPKCRLQVGEILTTQGGSLQCSHVLHTVRPNVNGECGTNRDVELLGQATKKCLCEAVQLGCSSIAFPAIGSGAHGLVLRNSALAMLQAINEFLSAPTGVTPLEEVRIVLLEQQLVDVYAMLLGQVTADSASTSTSTLPQHLSSAATVVVHQTATTVDHPSKDDEQTAQVGMANDISQSDPVCCPICKDPEDECDMQALPCGHEVCKECLVGVKKSGQEKCPTCNVPFGRITGDQPANATMTSKLLDLPLPGHMAYKTIQIDYVIPAGIQTEQHRNPGKSYPREHRVAYLPDSTEGRELHQLLKRAFDAKLVFTIGHSPTRNADDVVTWNDIHHKTHMNGSP